MSDPSISLCGEGGVRILRLDNERKLNALTPSMLDDLERHCAALERDPAARALLVTGAGTRAFCCGADIAAWGDLPPFDFARGWVRDGHRRFDRLARLPTPTIAVLNGHAFGGGLELAATCDLRVMASAATLALPEAGVGIVPGWSGTQRLATQIAPAVLKEMALLGRRVDAARALSLGFVNAVGDAPMQLAEAMAAEMLKRAPRALEVSKAMIGAALGEGAGAAIESLGGGLIASSRDKAEGVASFRDKRAPFFEGM